METTMQIATALSFTEQLCLAHDLNRGHPPADGHERASRADIVEYIDAFTVDKSPDHPTTAIAWDLQRTFGERDGRRLLLYASRRWDATPLRARDVVKMWWEEDYEPQAWVDEYLVDVIRDWRSERDRLQLCADAEKEWLVFDGIATQQELNAWRGRFGAWYLEPQRRLGPVTVVTAAQAQFARDMKSGKIPMPSNVVPLHPAVSVAPATQATTPAPTAVSLMTRSDAGPADSEDSLALSFASLHADDLRYCEEWGRWLQWTGARWTPDKTSSAYNLIRQHIRGFAGGMHFQDARKIANAKTVAAVERMSRTDRRIVTTGDIWDTDIWLLNTPDGTVDLRTGEMRDAQPSDHITKMTAVAPGGDCPTWRAFLDKSLAGDVELIAFIQRVLGYALTGDTREHALFFLYGQGGNGKGVLLNTVAGILGDYGKTAPVDTFIDSPHERHPTDLAGLRGARLVMASETEKGRRWAEAKIKMLTGGDPISARFMRQDFFEFVPQFKLVIAGNHKPSLRSVDAAMRRRMHLIPFLVNIPESERDTSLPERLKAEWPGIMNWLVEGCLAWQRDGLQPPAAVRAATDEYLSSEDVLGSWLDEKCDLENDAWAPRQDLFMSWSGWANSAREFVGTQKQFLEAMRQHGFEEGGRNGVRGFRGVRVRKVTPPPPPFPY
jgi:putative DNA primase/helicase